MNKSKRILKVPKESFLRNTLRKATRELVAKEKLLPPAPFHVMEQMAIDLLQKLNYSQEYIDFTIVLLGNESWRTTHAVGLMIGSSFLLIAVWGLLVWLHHRSPKFSIPVSICLSTISKTRAHSSGKPGRNKSRICLAVFRIFF